MALIAHWPLNGNTNDISGNGYDGVPTNVTYAAGKIGQAFENDAGNDDYITISNTPNVTYNQTIAMWLYPTSNSRRRNPWNKAYGGEGTITHETSGAFNYYWGTNGGNSSPYQGFGSGASIPLNTWTHIALVRDLTNNRLRWYFNGVVVAETTPSYTAAAATTAPIYIGEGYTSNYLGRINDVRLYDHALTDMEIQEIARAKILHYTFDDFQEPTTNLHNDPTLNIQYNADQAVSKSNWGVDGTLYARISDCPVKDDDSLMLEINITSAGSGGLYTDLSRYSPTTTYTLEEGKTYTRSWWVKSNQSSKSISGHVCSSNRGSDNLYLVGGNITVTKDWQKYEHTFTIGVGQGGEYHTRHIIYNDIFSVWITNIQIEEKSYATEFTRGTRTGQINDHSGFFNHSNSLTETNTPRWTSEAKLGTGAYLFNNATILNNYISKSSFYSPDNVTMTCWFKKTGDGLGTYHIPMNIDGAYYELSLSTTGNFRIGFYINGTRRTSDFSDSSTVDGEWHMLAGSFDGTAIKSYIDGQLVRNNTAYSGALSQALRTLYIGRFGTSSTYGPNGYIDDVRVYATALSDADILDLYQTRAEIEESGVFYAKSFTANVEETDNLIENGDPKEDLYYSVSPNTASGDIISYSYITDDGATSANKSIEFYFETVLSWGYGRHNIYQYKGSNWFNTNIEYTLSMYIKRIEGSGNAIVSIRNGSSTNVVSPDLTMDLDISDNWTKFSLTFTPSTDGTDPLLFFRASTGDKFRVSGIQLEQKDHATPFTSDYRPATYKPSTLIYGENEVTEQGIANFEDYSTAGIVDGLIGYWNLDKDLIDFSGSNYTATNYGGTFDGESIYFNGSSYITLPYGDNVNPSTNPQSFSMMVKKTASTDTIFFTTSQAGDSNARMYIRSSSNNGLNIGIQAVGTGGTEYANSLNLNEWHYIVVTMNGSTASLYLDGALLTTKSYTSYLFNQDIQVGRHDGSYHLTGNIKNIKIFNRALTDQEIAIEYNTMFNNEVQITEDGVLYAKDLKQY